MSYWLGQAEAHNGHQDGDGSQYALHGGGAILFFAIVLAIFIAGLIYLLRRDSK